jgi:hypothetical protein
MRDPHGRFLPGTPRAANAGRRKGTPNRLSLDVAERLAALRCDPLEGLAKIAANSTNPVAIRARCYAELAQCVYPRRKAVDSDADEPTEINFKIFTTCSTCGHCEENNTKPPNHPGTSVRS